MKITPTMNLDDLRDRMSPNGDSVTEGQAAKMRDLLNSNAEAYEWQDTQDVDDSDWFRMLDESANA